jgi:hypothetical protein
LKNKKKTKMERLPRVKTFHPTMKKRKKKNLGVSKVYDKNRTEKLIFRKSWLEKRN